MAGSIRLLVNHACLGELVLERSLGEPQLDLLLGTLDRIGAMANVATNSEGVIATNRSGLRRERVRRAEHSTTRLDGIETFKDHAEHGAGLHVLDQAGKKGLFLEIAIVIFEVLFGREGELCCDEFEAAFFESGHDLADETAVDAIGLLRESLGVSH